MHDRLSRGRRRGKAAAGAIIAVVVLLAIAGGVWWWSASKTDREAERWLRENAARAKQIEPAEQEKKPGEPEVEIGG